MRKTFELTYLKSTKNMHVYQHREIGAHYFPIALLGDAYPDTITLTIATPGVDKDKAETTDRPKSKKVDASVSRDSTAVEDAGDGPLMVGKGYSGSKNKSEHGDD